MRNISLLLVLSFFKISAVLGIEESFLVNEHNELIKSSFSGVVFIAKSEQVLYSKAFGFSDRDNETKFSDNTVFDIGSITKQFLATSVMKLSEQGLLSVEDELSMYFKDVPEDKKKIKLHHLLTHTAGLPTNLSKYRLYDIVSYKKLPSLAFNEKLLSKPGEKYHYSNIGYSLLARIVESVTQENWEQFIRKSLLLPSGLNDTGYRIPMYKSDRLAVNYGADQNAFQRFFSIEADSRSVGHSLQHLYNDPGERWMEGAGGFMSTISDMHRWYLTIRSGNILSIRSWEKLFTPYVEEGNASHYGYGWSITTNEDGNKLITHNGSNGYSFAEFKYYPIEDLFVFIVTNDIDNYPEELMNKLSNKAVRTVTDKSIQPTIESPADGSTQRKVNRK
ncbi:MAG: serine hydrolase domain-containing protein [Kangiellaceae bacterium]|jgi:CubicO group peptidase (beta-lactamase class C family)